MKDRRVEIKERRSRERLLFLFEQRVKSSEPACMDL